MEFSVQAGAFWVLGVLYFLVVAYCVRHYIRVWTTKQKQSPHVSDVVRHQQKNSWAPFFYPMLIVGCSIRGGFMLAEAGNFIKPLQIVVLLNAIPTWVLFSAYMIVLLSWAQLYHSADKMATLRLVYFCANFVFYSIFVVLYVLGIQPGQNLRDPSNFYRKAIWFLGSFMYFICSITFLAYALLLVKFLRVALFATKFDTIKQINYFTFLVVVVSLLRCVVVMIEALGKLPSDGHWWSFEIVYYAILELLPLVVMVQIFQMHKIKQGQTTPTAYSPLLSSTHTPPATIPPAQTPFFSSLFSTTPTPPPTSHLV